MKSRMPIWMFTGVATLSLGACSEQSPAPQPRAAQTAAPHKPMPTELRAAIERASLTPANMQPVLVRSWGEIWGFAVDRTSALKEWERYRAVTLQTGYYPLLVTLHDENRIVEDPNSSPSTILERAAAINAKEWFSARIDDLSLDGEDSMGADFDKDDPKVHPPTGFESLNVQADGQRAWFLVLIPTTQPWEAFAYLMLGGWNAYPMPEEHVAAMKYWHEKFGAEPVIVTDDVIEMKVLRPPTSESACRELALEQAGYTAGDLVNQGYGHYGTLARCLHGSPFWFFWWD